MPRRRAVYPLLLAAGMIACRPAMAAPPEVVASIKPLHSLAASVMDGVAAPALLLGGTASPHAHALKPSEAARLGGADLVIWVGPGLEGFLVKAIDTLAPHATVIEAAEIPGLVLYAPRAGGVWPAHDHGHDRGGAHEPDGDDDAHDDGHDDGHDGGEHDGAADYAREAATLDPHLWLDPGNAKVIAAAIAEALIAADPANAAAYEANAQALGARLDALDAEIASLLAPVAGRPFIVFHDAYQYFEARYGLAAAGAIATSPEQPPGARGLSELRALLRARGAVCVFSEPQFEPALAATLVEGTGARNAELDPLGAALPAGPGLYEALMRGLAGAVAGCLAG